MSRRIGIPDKVLRRAMAAGAHNDCLVAGPYRSCVACTEITRAALDDVYGELPTRATLLAAIVADLRAEPDA